MSDINDGGPAFPMPIAGCNDGCVYNTMEQSSGKLGGMTLRDYFAAKAMQGFLTHHVSYWERCTRSEDERKIQPVHPSTDLEIDAECGFVFLSEDAYKLADAMIAERNRKPETRDAKTDQS